MILITGTELEVTDLPLSDMVEYQIENTTHKMGIKLKTIAKSSDCQHIYILDSNKSLYTVTDELLEKITYFNDDKELISLLNMGATSNEGGEEKDIFDEDAEPIVVVPDFGEPKPIVHLEKKEEEVSDSNVNNTENDTIIEANNDSGSNEDEDKSKD